MNTKHIYIGAILIAIVSLWSLFLSQITTINGDEGFYLVAAQMVSNGAVPYVDFFYPQMPYLPYILAPVTRICSTWSSIRIFHSLMPVLICAFVLLYLRKRHSFSCGVLGTVFLASNSLFMPMHIILKPYGLSTLFMYLAVLFVLLLHGDNGFRFISKRRQYIFALSAGLFGSLSIGTRLTMIFPFLVIALFLIYQRNMFLLLTFIAGSCIGACGILVSMFMHFDSFIFNNLTYHSIRSSDGLIGNLKQKVGCVREFANDSQYITLLIFALFGTFRLHRSERMLLWSVVIGIWISAVLPTPVWHQYFTTSVPFLILLGAPALCMLNRRSCLALCSLLCLYVCIHIYDAKWRSIWRPPLHTHSIACMQRINGLINAVTTNRESIISNWPGYLYGSHATIIPGMENHFSNQVYIELGKETAESYSIINYGNIGLYIKSNNPPVILENAVSFWKLEWSDREGYTRVWNEENASVYIANNRLDLIDDSLRASSKAQP